MRGACEGLRTNIGDPRLNRAQLLQSDSSGSVLGTDIIGGQTRRIVKGEVFVISREPRIGRLDSVAEL